MASDRTLEIPPPGASVRVRLKSGGGDFYGEVLPVRSMLGKIAILIWGGDGTNASILAEEIASIDIVDLTPAQVCRIADRQRQAGRTAGGWRRRVPRVGEP